MGKVWARPGPLKIEVYDGIWVSTLLTHDVDALKHVRTPEEAVTLAASELQMGRG